LLTEKLALAHELATLKPELEHLRSQTVAHQGLLSEKLTLQRQVSSLQVELENEKRTTQRALAKEGKNNEQDVELKWQVDELKKELREARKMSKESAKNVERLEKEIEGFKRAAERAAAKGEKSAEQETALDGLRLDLSKEKRDREKAEKAIQKSQTEWEAQKSLLDDKLAQFRTKLRATKDKLNETETELQRTQTTGMAKATTEEVAGKSARNPRKRVAAHVDPDATIGTPGDAPAKRGKRHASVTAPGDKSTFSITPFLNRTTSFAPESPQERAETDAAALRTEVEDDAGSPSAIITKNAKKVISTISKPLAPASSAKTNVKPIAQRKKPAAAKPALEIVPEERESPSHDQENVLRSGEGVNGTTTTTKVSLDNPLPKFKRDGSKPQPRKSLLTFASFNVEPPVEKQKKKKKLLGSNSSSFLGKTLFDDDEEGALPAKPVPGKGLFAARALAKSRGVAALGKGATMAVDGFAFSPLKRHKRAGSVAN